MRGKRGERGSLLVEMLVAALVLAVATSTMAGLMLQGRGQGGRLQRKEQAAMQMARLLNEVRNYVTSDSGDIYPCGEPDQPRCPPGKVHAERGGNRGTWHLPGDTCTRDPGDPEGLCYALDPGWHTADSLLGEGFNHASPYRVVFSYLVTRVDGLPRVQVFMDWEEPKA